MLCSRRLNQGTQPLKYSSSRIKPSGQIAKTRMLQARSSFASSVKDEEETSIPNNWGARKHQVPLWDYLEFGGKRAVAVWHRRAGKDSTCLNLTAFKMHQRVGTYWHMLPEARQGRKVVWDAIDGQGRRVIDQAFPAELREATNSVEMSIKMKCGSLWQVVGSDNYNSLVGANPVGVVFSEYAISKPSAWDYIRPILAENDGWAVFIFTPRGRNHGFELYETARTNRDWFNEILTVNDTQVITPAVIEAERQAGMSEEMIEQEFYCSFESALVGSYYGKFLNEAQKDGRIGDYGQVDGPVHLAWDLGRSDDTSIWFWQMVGTKPRVIDHYASFGHHLDHYIDVLRAKGYQYGSCWIPHDGRSKTLSAHRTIEEQLFAADFKVRIVPNALVQDGITAARRSLALVEFDKARCKDGLESLWQYSREWDEDNRCFKEQPKHDWTSHDADAFRYFALVWDKEPEQKEPEPTRWPHELTVNEIIERHRKKRLE